MNKRTLKIIGIAAAHLPLVLVLIMILTILAAIMSATGQEPDTAPVFDQQPAFERIDAALKELDQEYAGVVKRPLSASFFTLHTFLFSPKRPWQTGSGSTLRTLRIFSMMIPKTRL